MTLHIASLAIYPVKGLRGIGLASAGVEQQGLEHDRRWAILRPNNVVLTQRDLPAMARLDAIPIPSGLRLEATGHPGVDAQANGRPITLEIWRTKVAARCANPEASAWLTQILATPCTLVHLADPTARAVTPDLARPGDVVSLADGFPLLVTTEASLATLNSHLSTPVHMARFRPNLVVEGALPWAEDTWRHIRIGFVRLRLASPCARCTVITLDQRTGAPTARNEPLRTLGTLHRDEAGRITFGWNAVPESLGSVAVGDTIEAVLQ